MKLKVTKNKTVVDSDNNFTYVVEVFNDADILSYTHVQKIPPTIYMTPDETKFSLVGIINQASITNSCIKNSALPTDQDLSGFDVDNCEVEEIVV